MNFISWLAIMMSNMQDYQSFNFIVNFWKKDDYHALFMRGFPMVKYLCKIFHDNLAIHAPEILESI